MVPNGSTGRHWPSEGYCFARRMPEIALEPRPGDSLGPYRITRVIGRGRMGIVFEGTEGDGEPVALKVVTTELSQDEVFLRRFRREVKAAQKIEHPNVVPVLDDGVEGGLPYLVQRLIPGGSLADRVTDSGPLSLEEAVRLLAGAAAGIDALHDAGLVHRDIKPARTSCSRATRRTSPTSGSPRTVRLRT